MKISLLLPVICVALSSCTTLLSSNEVGPSRVSLNVSEAWFEGTKVQYIVTDVSDRDMAELMGANYAPRLRDAIPVYPKPPEVKTVLERVYIFLDGAQQNSVFPSIPSPLGFESDDQNYSPIWLMYTVEWIDKTQITELRSETDIFKAEAQGWVAIERTDIVINCPVVSIDGRNFLQPI